MQANILINAAGEPVLCDYGLAFIIVGSEFTSAKPAGPCRWAAPEVMNPPDAIDEPNLTEDGSDDEFDDPVVFFTKESDIYSFGMTIYEGGSTRDLITKYSIHFSYRYIVERSPSSRSAMIVP